MNPKKLMKKLMDNKKNISFNEMTFLLESYGFCLSRISGSHHIFVNSNIRELVNIQNVNGQVKPYQIKQFLRLVEKYNMQMGEDK